MSPLTSVRLALAGNRSDTARIALTAVGAALGTLALLAAATVLNVGTPAGLTIVNGQAAFDRGDAYVVDPDYVLPYSNGLLNEAGLRPGVAFALVLLTIPILAFVGQCSRLGAPARDRRLAAIRLAGGTPRQVVWVAAVETGLASIIGVALGFGAYFLGRYLIDAPDSRGTRPLPTDVLPDPAAMLTVGVAVPVFVTLLAVFALRRVVVTPFGVVRSTRRDRPSIAPGVFLAVGIGLCALVEPVNQYFLRHQRTDDLPFYVMAGLFFASVLAVSIGVVTGTGWITYAVGRLLQRFGRRPATLLAGRRMMADPWAGSRTFAAMLVSLVIGALAAGMHALTMTEYRATEVSNRRVAELSGDPYLPNDTTFYDRAYDLIGYAVVVAVVIATAGLLVALVDGIVARRRTLSALIATGVPRGVLGRAIGWQVMAPIVPAVLLAVSTGILLPRRVFREVVAPSSVDCRPASGDLSRVCEELPAVVLPVPVPWEKLALLAGGALTATAVVTIVCLLFLRMSTNVSELRTT